jgi:hypothetical protein
MCLQMSSSLEVDLAAVRQPSTYVAHLN